MDSNYDKINNNNSKCISINSCNNREQTTNSPKLNVNDESFLNRKKEGKIKIYFYVENLIDLIVNHKEYNEVNTGEGYLKGYIKTFNWEYFFFKGDISEEKNKLISKLLKEDYIYKDFNDIIIVTVDKLLDEKSKLFFSHFEKDSLQMSSQPLILFLTRKEENPKIEELYSLITNYYFDKRNIYAIKFPSLNKNENEKEIKLMLDFVNRGVSYYHGIGDLYDSINEDILSNYKLNILMCGRAGTGKSSFVNKFLKEKRAKEGEGLSQTQNIIRFTHPNYPLTIYDTPGFENEETVENVRKLLNQYNKILYDARKKINLILYFFIYNERSVMSMEVPLLKELIKYDAEIIFVMNFVTDSIEKSNYKRIYDIYKNSLTNIYKDVKDFDIKIIPINIYPKLDDDAEEIIIKRPAFGIDVLFNTVYNIFKPLIVDIKELDKIKDVEQLFSFLGKNKLYKPFQKKNDFLLSTKTEIINIILSYARYNIISFNREKNMKEMTDKICKKIIGEKYENFDKLMAQISSEEEILKLNSELINEILTLKRIEKDNPIKTFFKAIHHPKTLALGYACYKELGKKFLDNQLIIENDVNLDLVKNICLSLNKGIESFKLISEEFKNLYEKEKNKKKNLENEGNNEINTDMKIDVEKGKE